MQRGIKQLALFGELKNEKGWSSKNGEGKGTGMTRAKTKTIVKAQVIEQCSK